MDYPDFQKDKGKFEKQTQYYLNLLKYKDERTGTLKYINEKFSAKECHIISTGVINAIWQAWNSLWRNYWFLFINGGNLDSRRNICPVFTDLPYIHMSSNQNEMLFNFLYPTCPSYYRKKYSKKEICGYNEPTWGSTKSLSFITTYYSEQYTKARVNIPAESTTKLLGALNQISEQIDHLQKTRNSSIHLTKSTMMDIKKSVALHYSVNKSLHYPTDILYAHCIASGEPVIDNWIDNLTAALRFV